MDVYIIIYIKYFKIFESYTLYCAFDIIYIGKYPLNDEVQIIMNIKAICQRCKETFDVSGENLVYQKEFVVYDGQSIFLTYFDCPKCGRRHFVQIDDQKSKELLERCKRDFVSLSIAKSKGQSNKKNRKKKFDAERKYLSEFRNKLAKEYSGRYVMDLETSESFILLFSKF